MKPTLVRNGVIVTMNRKREILRGDLRLRDGKIEALAPRLEPQKDESVVDAREGFIIPGLIQAHTHLCQTLFRGWADDLELMDWLEKRIWPMEKAHDAESMAASARIGLLEMQLLGTTSILDMGSVDHHDAVFAEAEASGMRYWGGNCLMDYRSASGPLFRPTQETLDYCEALIGRWHGHDDRIQYAVSPRFAISCTEEILRAAVALRKKHKLIFHTHASENRGEIRLVKKRTGLDNIRYLKKLGCLGPSTVIAHGIHLQPGEVADIARSRTGITHCPSSNLKLASGIARIAEYRKKKIKLALGADGAPCNNMMDPFMEMRLAALLQKPVFGPTALPAREAFELATLGGARVLNAEERIGSLEAGKCADVVLVRRDHPSSATVDDPYSALVYSCSGRDVSHVWIAGKMIVEDGRHRIYDQTSVIENARSQMFKLKSRMKVKLSHRR